MSAEKKKITDPQVTIDVKNEKLEALVDTYAKEKTGEALNTLLNHLRNCRVLVPAMLNDKKQPIPAFLKSGEGVIYLPIYSQKEQIPKEPKVPAILNMPFLAVLQMANKPEVAVKGIVINPFTQNLMLKEELIRRMDTIERERAEAMKKAGATTNADGTMTPPPGMKAIKMDAKQYAVFERKQFEMRFLPKKFFEEGKAFMDELCEKKEAYIDELFEESYQQKRMYPYLPEEFSVMTLDISEELLIANVDLPNRDIDAASALRIYFAWNKQEEKGRYFSIEKGQKGNVFCEITSDWKHVNYGEAPVEGAEIQKIMDLLENETHSN